MVGTRGASRSILFRWNEGHKGMELSICGGELHTIRSSAYIYVMGAAYKIAMTGKT